MSTGNAGAGSLGELSRLPCSYLERMLPYEQQCSTRSVSRCNMSVKKTLTIHFDILHTGCLRRKRKKGLRLDSCKYAN